jgi:hypothetical protein
MKMITDLFDYPLAVLPLLFQAVLLPMPCPQEAIFLPPRLVVFLPRATCLDAERVSYILEVEEGYQPPAAPTPQGEASPSH